MIKKQVLLRAIKKSTSKSDIVRSLGWSINGNAFRKLRNLVKLYKLDISSIDGVAGAAEKNRKWKVIQKKCPVCDTLFEAKEGHPREKATCGYACSNTLFRVGERNGRYKPDSEVGYRRVCFRYHKKQCIICGESKIVSVHHYDEDNTNHSPENLIPMCPTHHQYFHSKYRNEVSSKIDEYRSKIMETLPRVRRT